MSRSFKSKQDTLHRPNTDPLGIHSHKMIMKEYDNSSQSKSSNYSRSHYRLYILVHKACKLNQHLQWHSKDNPPCKCQRSKKKEGCSRTICTTYKLHLNCKFGKEAHISCIFSHWDHCNTLQGILTGMCSL